MANTGNYSGTPCDLCGGGTYELPFGSIWCPAEDPHPGGRFVTRVSFERTPAKQAAVDALQAHGKRTAPREVIGPRVRKVAEIRTKVEAERPAADPYASGFDAFIGKDKS